MRQTMISAVELRQQVMTLMQEHFKPEQLQVIDESHLHIGHQGALPGHYHLALRIRANCFTGQNSVQIHRQIYHVLGALLKSSIHALRIDAGS
jgi:BolA family transcriptional regulator, general stress-responsive regulator